MSTYDLYGVHAASIDEAKAMLQQLLFCSFEEHDSEYHGGRYFRAGEERGENFLLKRNLDAYEDVPAEEEFPTHALLFYVNGTERSISIQEVFRTTDAVELLRHEDL